LILAYGQKWLEICFLGGFLVAKMSTVFLLNIDRFLYFIPACDQKWLEICFFGGFLVAKFRLFKKNEYQQISLF
jgi:hypothetical protein